MQTYKGYMSSHTCEHYTIYLEVELWLLEIGKGGSGVEEGGGFHQYTL